MKTLIVGCGEVGRALTEVLALYEPETLDQDELASEYHYDAMHICFPYSDTFVESVWEYRKKYLPSFLVIHSTVPVGTSRKCNAIHSPIRGVHPNLVDGIKTFPKLMGGEDASLAADYFRRAGLRVIIYDTQEATEAAKLFDTEYYRACIEFARRVKAYCVEHSLNFHEVYTLPNLTYNEGYLALGHPEYVRPVLQPIAGKIGGHCIMANKALL